MRKNFNYIFVCLLFCLVSIGNVYADNLSISAVTNNSEIKKGEKAVVDIKLTSDVVVSNCLFKFSNDDGIIFDSATSVNDWYFTIGSDGILVEGSLENTETPNNLNVLKVNYVVNGSGKLTIESQCVSIDDRILRPQNNAVVEFTAIEPQSDTTLKSLSVVGTKNIDFKSNRFSYAASIENTNFGLTFEASNPEYQDKIVVKDIAGNVITDVNNIKFNDLTGQGQMILYIIVNNTTTYELDVMYIERELDNSLSFVKINGSELELKDDVLDYVLDVDANTDVIDVSVALKDNKNFQIGRNSNIDSESLRGIFSINDMVDINIIVEPKDSSIGARSKTYTIHVNKMKNSVGPNISDKYPSVGDKQDVTTNPATGDISMFVMLLVLIFSLVASFILYKKNIKGYKY